MEDGSPIQSSLYDRDLTAWAEQQAAALRARAGGNVLDYENLAEEIDDVGRSLLSSCLSYIDVAVLHLLKLQFTPSERDNRGWRVSVRAARKDLRRDLSPTLRARLPEQMPELFEELLTVNQENDLGLDTQVIRETLPNGYSWEEVTGDWWPEPNWQDDEPA